MPCRLCRCCVCDPSPSDLPSANALLMPFCNIPLLFSVLFSAARKRAPSVVLSLQGRGVLPHDPQYLLNESQLSQIHAASLLVLACANRSRRGRDA